MKNSMIIHNIYNITHIRHNFELDMRYRNNRLQHLVVNLKLFKRIAFGK